MISNDQMSEIMLKHATDIIKEINDYGGCSPRLYMQHLANFITSFMMTISDTKPGIDRKTQLAFLYGYFDSEIMKQMKFHLDNDNRGLE